MVEDNGRMDLGLKGQTAVVTGASRGIGLAIVRALAAAGVTVITGAKSSSAELDELVRTAPVHSLSVDLADPAGPGQLTALAGDQIDILVNNVGRPRPTGGSLAITDEEWEASITLNLMAAVRTTRAALPVMLTAGRGAIVNICSVNARLPDPAVMDYSAAKAGVASFSKALSKEVGPKGIRVNRRAPARWPPTCGWGRAASRRPSARRPGPGPRTWSAMPRARW